MSTYISTDLAQPAVRKVGIALETVLDLSNSILLPLKILNERSKLIFDRNMLRYKEKLEKVDVQELTYLCDMFIKACIGRDENQSNVT